MAREGSTNWSQLAKININLKSPIAMKQELKIVYNLS